MFVCMCVYIIILLIQASLSFEFRMGRSTVCGIVAEVCEAIWMALQQEYVKMPQTEEEWLAISNDYEELWNFPHCVGAIDGKHVVMQAPRNEGSAFYNYKGTHSVVLLAICDAHYRFLMVDMGDAGRHSDGGVLSNSRFGSALDKNSLSLPHCRPLPGLSSPSVPYVIVGDEAFPLKQNMMRPYPGRNLPQSQSVYNYRLSRARRVIENSFGILAARWRIFHRPMIATIDHVVSYTKAAIALHNYLQTTESSVYCPTGFSDIEDSNGDVTEGSWREEPAAQGLEPVSRVGSNRYSLTAAAIRDTFKDYFSSPAGKVSWQYRHVNRTA